MGESLRILAEKLHRARAQARYLPRGLALVWAAARYRTVVWIALLVVQGLLPAATVCLTRLIVDGMVAAIRAGGSWQAFRPALLPAALMAGVLLLSELLRSVAVWVRAVQSDLVQDHITALIHEKSIDADLAFYESPDYYDHLHRARAEASYRPVALLECIGGLLQNGITMIAMGVVITRYGLWWPAALLVSTLPAFYVVLHYTVRQYEWRQRTTADERRTWYYDWLLTAGETAAELRLFALGNHFQSAYRALRDRLRNERLRLAKHQGLSELAAGAAALLVTGGSMAWMVRQTLRGMATLGDLALFYQAFNQGQGLMRTLLQNVSQLYANTLFLGNLFEFLELEPQVVDPCHPVRAPKALRDGIRFHNASFRYPGSDRLILADFNLTIPAGKITAIVGPNGSGKSTLIKLLCRLYDPEAGRIEVDGIDLRDLSTQDLRRLITVLFQEPVHYSTTAAENIALGDLRANPSLAEIEAAARAAGADESVARLPKGYENLLGRWFEGGTELSVGEWQRVALARAFLREAPIILLDEPTSAMDSWAEADWLDRFRSLAAGRTALLITHRFTTAMRADIIHVMADRHIVESGSHHELLARRGPYADSWVLQMEA